MNNTAAVYVRVAPAHITFVCKIFEGYEYLGVVTTLDRAAGVLVIRATPDTRNAVLDVVSHLPVPFTLLAGPNNE